mmetsp:Transcript_12048/g.38620  ORF Transcript_12048/g.38620 Transcript_12048/m.38620 type:complete len:218 (-) Transcript_12048:9-662(-)
MPDGRGAAQCSAEGREGPQASTRAAWSCCGTPDAARLAYPDGNAHQALPPWSPRRRVHHDHRPGRSVDQPRPRRDPSLPAAEGAAARPPPAPVRTRQSDRQGGDLQAEIAPRCARPARGGPRPMPTAPRNRWPGQAPTWGTAWLQEARRGPAPTSHPAACAQGPGAGRRRQIAPAPARRVMRRPAGLFEPRGASPSAPGHVPISVTTRPHEPRDTSP